MTRTLWLGLLMCLPLWAGNVQELENVEPLPEIIMGQADAPITLIEYSSLSCGHCADFHQNTLRLIKEKYIDKGMVKVYVRSYPSDGPALRATQLAWCGGEMRYLDLVSVLFENQQKWLFTSDPVAALKKLAGEHGITKAQFEACINDEELAKQIMRLRTEGYNQYQISATPTIIINGRIYGEALSFQEFEEIVRPLLTPAEGQE